MFATLPILPLAFFGLTWPLLLWGAALGAIPVVIHLLNRRKYRETSWAAMRFLLEAARKHSRRLRIEQLILLAVRTLLLLFLVAGLQGMYTMSTSTESPNSGTTHHIIVLDASYSMQFRTADDRPLFERARDSALEIVEAAPPGDVFNLVLITGGTDRTVVKTPTRSRRDFRNVLRRIEKTDGAAADNVATQLSATDECGQLPATFTEVAAALSRADDVPAKKVYFLSDFQNVTWRPSAQQQRETILNAVKSLEKKARLVMINVGEEHAANTAVTDFRTEQPFVTAGRELKLRATLQNFGSRQLPKRKVELIVDGQIRDTQTVTLEPGETRPVQWTYPNPQSPDAQPALQPGEHTIEVRLQDDRLNVDNRRRIAFPVKDHLRVLLVNGRPAGRERDEATFYLSRALRPTTSKQEWDGIIEPRVITAAELLGTDLTQINCLFLCNVRALKPNEARKLQRFVEQGGGLVIALGDRVDVDSYNAVLYDDGDGLLPMKLGQAVGADYAAGRLQYFDTSTLSHPIVEQFVGNRGTGLESVLTFRYVRVHAADDDNAHVVLRFQQKQAGRPADPAVLESPYGLGHVVLITTTVDAQWSTWSINPSFPAMMNEIVHFTVMGQWKERQREVGEEIVRGFSTLSGPAPSHVSVQLPDKTTRSVLLTGQDRWTVRRPGASYFDEFPNPSSKPIGRIPPGKTVRRLASRDKASQVRWQGRTVWVKSAALKRRTASQFYFDETQRSGIYEVKLRPPLGTTEFYAVNVDPAESNLDNLNEAGLKQDVLPGIAFDYRTRWQKDFEWERIASTHQNDLTRWLLMAVFCLLLVELLMAWNFFAGFLLLYGFVAMELTRQAVSWNPSTGVLLGLLLTSGFAAILYTRRRKQNRMRVRA